MIRAWIKPGDLLIAVLVLLPLALAIPRLLDSAGSTVDSRLYTLGRGAGILGLSMMLVSGAMSVRLPRLDRYFGGLTRLWHIHHVLGFCGFMLVLAHVSLLALASLPFSIEVAILTLFPPLSSWAIWIGWLALLGLALFLAESFKFFGEPHYQRWKWTHMIVAPTTLALAVVHAFPLAEGSESWLALGILAAISVVWRRVGSRIAGRHAYTISHVDKIADDVVELVLQPERGGVRYLPGQFVYLTPTDPALPAGRNEEHIYTISSAPQDELMRIGIKALGDATHALQDVVPGTRAWLEGPYGDFFERRFPARAQLWLGGGIGITPFVSAVRAAGLAGEAPSGGAHLFYLANDADRAYYLQILGAASADVTGLELTAHFFESEGPITEEFLSRHCPDFTERETYMCGPPPMLTHVRSILKRRGVPSARIHSEAFNLL